jgi:DNA-binding GntR family transcriptional regulator
LTRNVANADFREYILPTHQAILDAIKAGDQSKAVGLIEVHLESAYERVLSSYLEHASQPGDD